MMGSIVSAKVSGDYKRTMRFLEAIKKRKIYEVLDFYGESGVALLSSNTPMRTGKTASSWRYEKKVSGEGISLEWYNDNLANDSKTPVVVLIIKGHGTGTGGYVPPNDFATPLMESLFNEATEAVWRVVTLS